MFIINNFSTCFGHHYAHLQENKTCVTARGVLRSFCWMWLVAVVGRCVVGCEHCEGWFSISLHNLLTMHGHRNLKNNAKFYCKTLQTNYTVSPSLEAQTIVYKKICY